ncbi:hypothetical protein DM02DRAFT_668745 [Periconia macrospinosa]|uniref:Zn(2)-C6 fungal-type domain-containing protein n=1 Tax=Periconia macrospinosa TaxID=97972 RepID=A0A2V1E2J2_9PLEO|nr:hypothetical protein DM02DRAFT_668745 [Periconia macrospinosa]
MADGRPILPKLFNAPTAGADHSVYHSSNVKLTTQRKVSVACRVCQARRTKCDGARPQCGACNLRHSQCGYPTRAGQSHSQARKQKMQELENEKSVMLDILCHLQTTSPETAGEVLQRLRSIRSGDIEAMLTCIDRDRSDPSSQETLYSSKMDIESLDDLPRRLSAATTLADYQQSPSSTRSQDLNVTLSICGTSSDHEISVDETNASLDAFFTYATNLSSLFNRSKVAKLIEPITSTYGLTFIDLFNRPTSPQKTTELSELAGMLAIGMLYLRAQTSESLPSNEAAAFYYSIAKHGLDVAIEHNALRAMKLCTLLAFYNLSLYPSVALAYIGLGLNLGRDNGIDSSTFTFSEVIDHKPTLQTLVHLQCWLAASMDFVPESLLSPSTFPQPQSPTTLLQALQAQALKITLIKRSILHAPFPDTNTALPSSAVAFYREKLRTYYADLPPWMSLAHLHASSSSPERNGDSSVFLDNDTRKTVLYVHLFYMGTMMALARKIIAFAYKTSNRDEGGEGEGGGGRMFESIPGESRQAIEEGFVAAQMSARVLDLLLEEEKSGGVVDACWVCIYRFTAYTSSIMLSYHAAQDLLSGLSPSGNLDLISRCLRILTYCAQKDETSASLLTLVVRFTGVLQAFEVEVGDSTSAMKMAEKRRRIDGEEYILGDVIFTVYPGTTELHDVARELVGLMGRGVGGNGMEKHFFTSKGIV